MKRRSLLKKALSPILIRLTRAYLKKERRTTLWGIRLTIPTGVFHPSLYFSTKTFGKFLLTQELKHKKILEIGSGSGVISILASQRGAEVHCVDINPAAIEATMLNAQQNHLELNIQLSDLFEAVDEIDFDLILNNPPYYSKNPTTPEEQGWFAGKELEYFKRLFKDSKDHLAKNGRLWLVLSDDCDIDRINGLAQEESYTANTIFMRPTLLEKTYVIEYKTPI